MLVEAQTVTVPPTERILQDGKQPPRAREARLHRAKLAQKTVPLAQ